MIRQTFLLEDRLLRIYDGFDGFNSNETKRVRQDGEAACLVEAELVIIVTILVCQCFTLLSLVIS